MFVGRYAALFISSLVLAALLIPLPGCTRAQNTPAVAAEDTKKQTPALIDIGLEAQKNVGLRVAAVRVHALAEQLQVMGTVQPIDSRIARVRAMSRGRLQEVMVKVGDRVKAGDELARLDNMEAGELLSQLQTARAELRRVQVQQAAAGRQVERNRRLAEIGAIPRKEYEAIQAEQAALGASVEAQQGVVDGLLARLHRFGVPDDPARNAARTASLSLTAIRAPFAGVVIQAAAAPGEVVTPESELFQIADLSQVWVQAEVYEKDIGKVRIGQAATITIDAYPDQAFVGKVAYVGDALDSKTRTVRVRCETPNAGGRLKLDMFASVKLPTTFSRTAIAVPNSAILAIENHNIVFVRKTDTAFEPRRVQVGKTVNGATEIVAGLAEGETIVTQGAFHLKSILMAKEIGEE